MLLCSVVLRHSEPLPFEHKLSCNQFLQTIDTKKVSDCRALREPYLGVETAQVSYKRKPNHRVGGKHAKISGFCEHLRFGLVSPLNSVSPVEHARSKKCDFLHKAFHAIVGVDGDSNSCSWLWNKLNLLSPTKTARLGPPFTQNQLVADD